jgi:hypothetical protein
MSMAPNYQPYDGDMEEWIQFDPDDAPSLLTTILELCQKGDCLNCPGHGEHEGQPVFCVHFCHRADLPEA